MATTDEILADPIAALDLPDGAMPLSAIVLVEYARPGEDGRKRLALVSDDDLPPWVSIGMLRFAAQLEYDAVGPGMADDDEP